MTRLVGLDRAVAPRRGSGRGRRRTAGRTCSPTGGLTRSGGRPGMVASREWAGSSSLGMLFISASVYGIRMLANSVLVGAFSTMRPPYITAISSVCPATTPRSWVTRITDMLRSWRCSAMRSRICDCTVTSSAVVGSSANSSVGPQARAMAIITRWRMPPDSSCGYWSRRRAASGIRTSRSSRSAVSRAVFLDISRCTRSGSAIWSPIFISGFSDVIGSWKIIAISWPQTWRICDVDRPISSCPSNFTDPSRIRLLPASSPITDRDSTVLPEPDSPTMPSVRPRSSEKLTPSTARTTPRGVRKWVIRSVTSSSVPLSTRWLVCRSAIRPSPRGCRSGGPASRRSC